MMVGQSVVLLAAHLDLVARHRAAADHEGARGAVLAVGLAVRATEYRLDVAGMGVVVLVDAVDLDAAVERREGHCQGGFGEAVARQEEIGRASWRERVCQYG